MWIGVEDNVRSDEGTGFEEEEESLCRRASNVAAEDR